MEAKYKTNDGKQFYIEQMQKLEDFLFHYNDDEAIHDGIYI